MLVYFGTPNPDGTKKKLTPRPTKQEKITNY